MKIYTLNVGQGQFVVITGETEAIIVDTFIALNPTNPIINVKGALADILKGKNLIGLVVTGFDADHFNEIGLKIILNKYRPNWIMYPKYFKETTNAKTCFGIIDSFDNQNIKFTRISVKITNSTSRFYSKISKDFDFEIFSPHPDDMDSSNNCSLVCKIIERSTNKSYLVTGDTECERWNSIVNCFGSAIKSDVLDAPHHGSKNGITLAAMNIIKPNTVLISAGVGNKYGHPDKEALNIYNSISRNVFRTNQNGGISLLTEVTKTTVQTYKYE